MGELLHHPTQFLGFVVLLYINLRLLCLGEDWKPVLSERASESISPWEAISANGCVAMLAYIVGGEGLTFKIIFHNLSFSFI